MRTHLAISVSDVYLAFRQAKATLFFDSRAAGLMSLARFENRLPKSIPETVALLNSGEGLFDGVPLGRIWLVPKRLEREVSIEPGTVRVGPALSRDALPSLEVQVRMSPSPQLAIAETIFLWRYGPALESLLGRSALGNRLDLRRGAISTTRRNLFEYWPEKYQEFRTAPLREAERALKRGADAVTVVSADLASFYDTVGTDFLVDDAFAQQLRLNAVATGRAFDSAAYARDAASLLRYYDSFRVAVGALLGEKWARGVPIGAIASRVVANVSLATLDEWIQKQRRTAFMRRYVDDIVIVVHGTELLNESGESVLRALFPVRDTHDGVLPLDVGRLQRHDSDFTIQMKKVRVHHVGGIAGLRFLQSVRGDFLALVSERRSFLDGELSTDDAATHIARARGSDGSPLRVLREADRVNLERYAVSTRLASLERVATLVSSGEAARAARPTQRRIREVFDRDVEWFSHIDVLLRLLSLALATRDSDSVRELLVLSERLWGHATLEEHFEKISYRGRSIGRRRAWVTLRAYLDECRLQAMASSVRPEDLNAASSFVGLVRHGRRQVGLKTIRRIAHFLVNADLRARDREDDRFPPRFSSHYLSSLGTLDVDERLRERLVLIETFLSVCRRLGDTAWSQPPHHLFLLTRPPKYFDLARRMLYRSETHGFLPDVLDQLRDLVNAVRGTQYQRAFGRVIDPNTVQIPSDLDEPSDRPRLILGNLTCDLEHWVGAATRAPNSTTGAPVLTFARLLRVATVLRKAALHAGSRHGDQNALLVLPELCLPRAWFREVANYVASELEIGLVTGLEYLHHRAKPEVVNQVFGVFPGGYDQVVTWPWTKRVPAREEAKHLAQMAPPLRFGARDPRRARRPRTVVRCPIGDISVLICSELIEARRVADLLRRVELVLVPAWNTDTASYDHLVQSVGLQLNAIVAVVNNGKQSDCRVWAPLADRWRRDLCRLIARESQETIAVDLPLDSLRSFRLHANSVSDWRPLPPDWE